MSYKKIPEIPRSDRTYWSPEKGGRIRQMIGGQWVKKFAYSPFTAKARKQYTFYADVELLKEIESPPGSGKVKKSLSLHINVGTYLEFRDMVLSGEARSRIQEIIDFGGVEGQEIVGVSFWRGREVNIER